MSDLPFAIYNPALLPPEVLLDEFTARRPLLETLLGIVRGNKLGEPPQHCLLIGARGMGKTTTLWAVAHRVNRDAELSRLWQPVVFDEESRRVGDLADFWLEAIRQWEFAVKDKGDRAGDLLAKAGPDIEERAREVFVELVKRSGKRALLLIDNLNDVFSSIRDAEPLHRLRAFLMKDSGVMVIGGATSYFEAVTSVDQPFYDFFRSFELKPLSLEEMRESLRTLARIRKDEEVEKNLDEREGSIRALHLFTGGNPRLVKTFYRLLRDGLHAEIREDLEKLLDEFTPYFKAIVDALPGQQQRIFDAVALAWDPVEVAKLATATRLPSNQVSAQLKALGKAGLVREAVGHPKRKAYLLSDRFSNIHYLMRHGRAARNRLDWFVATVRLLFPDKKAAEVLAKLAHDSAECGAQGMLDAWDVIHSGLNRAESADSRRHLLQATLKESWSGKAWEALDEWFDIERAKKDLPEMGIIAFCQDMPAELRKKLGYKPEESRWWYRLVDFLEEKAAWQLVEQTYRKAIELGPKDAWIWNGLGIVLDEKLNRPGESEKAFRKAIELDASLAGPWNGLGKILCVALNRPAEAEEAYRTAIKLDASYAAPWNGLGNVLSEKLSRPAEAEQAYRKAIELDASFAYPWNGLGNVLEDKLNRPEEAEEAFRKAIELDPERARPKSALAWILAKDGREPELSRRYAREAVSAQPEYGYARGVFRQVCGDDPKQWQAVLPILVAWSAKHPKGPEAAGVFDFTVDGFLRYARLQGAGAALRLFEVAGDASLPFETLQDALRASMDRDHLHKLAPERQAVAIEMMKRLEKEELKAPTEKKAAKGKKKWK